MRLWIEWMSLVNVLRPAFSRERAFHWMVMLLIGFTVKFDALGVTSLARGVGLLPSYYTCMLHFFTSTAVDLPALRRCWVQLVLEKFTTAMEVNGRRVLIADGIKIGKEGKKMPGVKSLHQESESNTKPSYIMGHSIQVVGLLISSLSSFFCVPLSGGIHEGCRFNCKDKRSLLDKLFELMVSLDLSGSYYFVADRYYCSGRLIKQLTEHSIDLVVRMKHRSVGYELPLTDDKKNRGRPRRYGNKVKLYDWFNTEIFNTTTMPGDNKTTIQYCTKQLLWRPLGQLVQFVLVIHPTKGKSIFLCSDLNLDPLSVILLYNLRFKIEVSFKQAVHQVGTFMYHFWLKCMRPIKRGDGEWLLHFAAPEFKLKVTRKLHAYELFIQLGLIAQGLMHYLSVHYSRLVWQNFGTWLRTIRPNIPASEKVVSMAMAQTYGEFIVDEQDECNVKKFIRKRIDFAQIRGCFLGERLAA